MTSRLEQLFPDADRAHLVALANVWEAEKKVILKRMLDIHREEGGAALPRAAREDAIFELARLSLFLQDRIISHHAAGLQVSEASAAKQRELAASADSRERIENTARILAERIWKPLVAAWWQKYPAAVTVPTAARRSRIIPFQPMARTVGANHFSPVFANRYFARPPKTTVRVYERTISGEIRHSDRGYRSWGSEPWLYSPELEAHLGLIETDAEKPYRKLVEMIPLDEPELRCWIAFLLAQHVRTPTFLSGYFPSMKRVINERGIDFPTETGHLVRAYESMFTDNDLFAWFYRSIVGRSWTMLEADDPGFLRSDTPLLTATDRDDGWVMFYPMTPNRCLAIGPSKRVAGTVIPTPRKVTPAGLDWINGAIAGSARRTVIGAVVPDDRHVRELLRRSLTVGPPKWSDVQAASEYWGPIR